MKYLLLLLLLVSFLHLNAQNVGVNQASPQEDLHVTGNIRTDSALVMHPHTALTPADAITLPNSVSTITISLDDATETDNDITGPANPKEGQVLYIANLDDDPATFAGATLLPEVGFGHFLYLGGSWRVVSVSPAETPAAEGCRTYLVNSSADLTTSGTYQVIPGLTQTLDLKEGETVSIIGSVSVAQFGLNHRTSFVQTFVNATALSNSGQMSLSTDYNVAWIQRNNGVVVGGYTAPTDDTYTFDIRIANSSLGSGNQFVGLDGGGTRACSMLLVVCPPAP